MLHNVLPALSAPLNLQDCIRMLRNVLPALIAPDAKLLLVEHVLPEPPYCRFPTSPLAAVCLPLALALDLEMMANFGGRERTRAEWERLLEAAGFEALGWKPIVGYVHIITAHPLQASTPHPHGGS